MTIDTTATEPPRNWFLDLAKAPTEDLLRHAEHLRAKLAHAQERGLRADARAYELRLLDVERAIAIHNRRATEAEEQRVTEERNHLLSIRQLVARENSGGLWSAELTTLDRLAAAPITDEQRDSIVTIADEAFGLGPVEPLDETLTRIERGIHEAHRRSENELSDLRQKLAAATAAGEMVTAERDVLQTQREADLRKAFLAGGRYIADNGVVSVVDLPREAAEYARSKAGG